MRVLLTLHHRIESGAGAPGATLALGEALGSAGWEVSYYGFGEAFGSDPDEGVRNQLRFPWRLAAHLRRHAASFDVIDSSTGDAWLWASLRRPGGAQRPALVTRTHGLEHIADLAVRARGGFSRMYGLYHGGLRLWEVRRSLALADQCVMLNAAERDYAWRELEIPGDRLAVTRNAVAAHFLAAPDPQVVDGPLRLAFVGSWIERKGASDLAAALEGLLRESVDFRLTLLGVGDAAQPLEDLPATARELTTVVPHFANEELPGLLAGHELLVFPSRFEGSSVALLEAMACGLAPLATRVGANAEVIEDGVDGFLVGDAAAIVERASALSADRELLLRLRRAAQVKARGYDWESVAADTIALYERALAARSTASTNSGPSASQV